MKPWPMTPRQLTRQRVQPRLSRAIGVGVWIGLRAAATVAVSLSNAPIGGGLCDHKRAGARHWPNGRIRPRVGGLEQAAKIAQCCCFV